MQISLLQRWYTRIIGIASCLSSILLIVYVQSHGLDIEALLKATYVVIGIFATYWGFWSSIRACKEFCFWHGLTFLVIGTIGWLFPGLGGIPTFHQPETALHTIIGVTGFFFGVIKK